MEKIKDIIEKIKNGDEQWIAYTKIEEIENEETRALINRLITQIRYLIKQNDEKVLEQIESMIVNEKMYQELIEISKLTLRHYKAWAAVRALEESNEELVQILLQNIMDKYMLRLEFDFQKTYVTYEVKDSDTFIELLASYDTMVSYYIQRHYGKKTMIQDMIEETGVKNETAEVFADLIERNYRKLQINAILDGLQKLENG